jgi:hypothetical protein
MSRRRKNWKSSEKTDQNWLIDGLADLDEVGEAIRIEFLMTTSTPWAICYQPVGPYPEENELPAVTYENLVSRSWPMEEKRVSKVENSRSAGLR